MYNPSFGAPITANSVYEFRVSASATSVLILSGCLQRRAASIYNHGSAALYLRYSSDMNHSASFAAFSVKLSSGSYYELPAAYQGTIHGIWDSANGYAFITDFQSGE